jgi:hypothetical protein
MVMTGMFLARAGAGSETIRDSTPGRQDPERPGSGWLDVRRSASATRRLLRVHSGVISFFTPTLAARDRDGRFGDSEGSLDCEKLRCCILQGDLVAFNSPGESV